GQRLAVEQVRELGIRAAAQGAGSAFGVRAPAQGAVRGRRLRHDDVVAAPREVDVPLGLWAPGVCRWTQLADQAHLVQRRGELRSVPTPLDALGRTQRGLDRRTLPCAAEVRTQPCLQIARLAHVQHLAEAVAEEVDAGPRRRTADETALAVHD